MPQVLGRLLGTARISPADDVLSEYLFVAVSADHFQHQILRRLRGATFPQIPLGELKELEVPVPPLGLQREFVEVWRRVEEQGRISTYHLEQLDELFASMQQRAFRGEL